MAITLQDAETKLAEWMAADTAVASGQMYELNGRRLSRVDGAEIRENIKFWNSECIRLSRGGIRVRGGTPLG